MEVEVEVEAEAEVKGEVEDFASSKAEDHEARLLSISR